MQLGLVGDRDEVLADYSGEATPWSVPDGLSVPELAAKAGVSERTVYRVRAGDVQPQADTARQLLRVAVQQVLGGAGR